MARLSRFLQTENAEIFHIMNRGILKQEIFHDDEDALRFTRTLCRYKEKYAFEVYHWCLMPNHYHLVLGVQRGRQLTKIIGACQQIYAHYYHRKYKTAGKLFQTAMVDERVGF